MRSSFAMRVNTCADCSTNLLGFCVGRPGFKLFTRDTAALVFGSLHLQRWAFDIELIYVCELMAVPMAVSYPGHWPSSTLLMTTVGTSRKAPTTCCGEACPFFAAPRPLVMPSRQEKSCMHDTSKIYRFPIDSSRCRLFRACLKKRKTRCWRCTPPLPSDFDSKCACTGAPQFCSGCTVVGRRLPSTGTRCPAPSSSAPSLTSSQPQPRC